MTKTEWVRVCVRPEQSFTRAILEIYMADGGTLGDVISALRKQKQFRIIQEISDKAEEFLMFTQLIIRIVIILTTSLTTISIFIPSSTLYLNAFLKLDRKIL